MGVERSGQEVAALLPGVSTPMSELLWVAGALGVVAGLGLAYLNAVNRHTDDPHDMALHLLISVLVPPVVLLTLMSMY